MDWNDECIKYTEQELLQVPGIDKLLKISRTEILKIDKRSLKSDILKKCEGRNLWALFAFIDDMNMICLEVASADDIATEIVKDLCSMQPICDDDTKSWAGKLHKKIFDVTYGLDFRCQKYRNMYDNYNGFYVVSIDHLMILGKTETYTYDKVKYAEVMIAYMTRSLYWKPFGEESKILKIVQGIDDGSVD